MNKKNYSESGSQQIGKLTGVASKAIANSLKNAERLKKRENKLFTVRCERGKIFYTKAVWEWQLQCYRDY